MRTTSPLATLRALICDVDGTLAPAQILYQGASSAESAASGYAETLKAFHVRDGHRIVAARRCGLWVGICSGRDSVPLRTRARDLAMDPILLQVSDKVAALEAWSQQAGLSLAEICFMGDDYPDLSLIGKVGLFVAPADADAVILRRADQVTVAAAGAGAVAEVLGWMLRYQDGWPASQGLG